MAQIIIVTDLPTSLQGEELVNLWVNGANSRASRIAPCLTWDGSEVDKPAPTQEMLDEAKLILVGAVSRWAKAGSGGITQQGAGPMQVTTDTRTRPGYNLWPSEIEQLQDICSNGRSGQSAFSITPYCAQPAHDPWCSLTAFAGAACDCRASL